MIITPEKARFLAAALDTHVKTNGLSVAAMAAMVLAEIQADLTQANKSVQSTPEAKSENNKK